MNRSALVLSLAVWLALGAATCAAAGGNEMEEQRALIEDICAVYDPAMDAESNDVSPEYERQRARLDVLWARWQRLYPNETRFDPSLCPVISHGWTWPPGAWTWPPAKPGRGCKQSPDKDDPCATAKESACRDHPNSVECQAYTNMLSHSLCGGAVAQIAREQCAALSKMEKERR